MVLIPDNRQGIPRARKCNEHAPGSVSQPTPSTLHSRVIFVFASDFGALLGFVSVAVVAGVVLLAGDDEVNLGMKGMKVTDQEQWVLGIRILTTARERIEKSTETLVTKRPSHNLRR
jgi:hypothetical protein